MHLENYTDSTEMNNFIGSQSSVNNLAKGKSDILGSKT